MSGAVPKPIVHHGRVGKFRVRWTFDGVFHHCEWSPRMPHHAKEVPMRRYRRVRSEFLEKVGKEIAVKPSEMLVIEL